MEAPEDLNISRPSRLWWDLTNHTLRLQLVVGQTVSHHVNTGWIKQDIKLGLVQ